MNMLEKCNICPHECGVNRMKDERGICNAGDRVKIALSSLHYNEEPCISGENGSGTIFFSNCNLHCKYCQNHKISSEGYGKEISIKHLAKLFIKQQEKGANNINLVTPTIYTKQIIEAIKIAKTLGLIIPIIYNSSGYEKVETLKMLEGYIDVYLPDLKYSDDTLAKKYSNVDNYFVVASDAIKEMYRQVGEVILDDRGIIKSGIIIRHLVLPNNIVNSKNILKWIKETFSNNVYVSVMAQYFPTYLAKEIKELNRKVNKKEFDEIENYLFSLELENGYIQELGEHEEEYVPDFDLSE